MLLTKIKQRFIRTNFGSSPVKGIYHFKKETGNAKNRVHLRVEEDGKGLLMVNAAKAYHLNPTATIIAYGVLSGYSQDMIINLLRRTYDFGEFLPIDDINSFISTTELLINPEIECPNCLLDLETDLPFSNHPSAPYRMDIALTYQCNNDCTHCYNARSRKFPSLAKSDWFRVIDKLWDLGIPHIVFTGGEPTMHKDLPDLIAYAEKKGIITGINTNGIRLADENFLNQLVAVGLDHIQITLESHDALIHDAMVNHQGAWDLTVKGIKNVLKTNLYMMTNTTMLKTNYQQIPATLDFLAELGVPTTGLNALIFSGKGKEVGTGLSEKELAPLLEIAKQKTLENHQKLIWYTPTQYCRFNPVTSDLGVKGCSAALYNMCLEPNGDVLPCQSYYQPVGNILSDDWHSIWNHNLSQSLRNRNNLPEKCNSCDLLLECGGGCPLLHEQQTSLEL